MGIIRLRSLYREGGPRFSVSERLPKGTLTEALPELPTEKAEIAFRCGRVMPVRA